MAANRLERFAEWLRHQELYAFTLNGFPYGSFHRSVVKDNVCAPDWTRPGRLDYTMRLAQILARLLPADIEGGISTVPVSYKRWHATDAAREAAFDSGVDRLLHAARLLARLAEETGRVIHLDLEPEPDCLLEDAAETAALFERLLRRAAPSEAATVLRHLRVCWDVSHAAVEFEPTADALQRFDALGVAVGKLQLSSALRAPLGSPAERQAVRQRLQPFAESTYLHQVVERRANGTLRRHADLGDALAAIDDPQARE